MITDFTLVWILVYNLRIYLLGETVYVIYNVINIELSRRFPIPIQYALIEPYLKLLWYATRLSTKNALRSQEHNLCSAYLLLAALEFMKPLMQWHTICVF